MREMVQLVKRATRVEGALKIGDNTEPRQDPATAAELFASLR